MTSNRIQKLLFSEYSDFEDIVLVEGPFAETDKQGKGIRQVQMGLTPTKLILASYFVEPVDIEELGEHLWPRRGQDPDIESFELVSAYPVECVNLSVYRHRRRQTIKARFCNGKVMYYEIGGWQERKMLWSVWCERLKFLSPYESGTSLSETSVATSSSTSSLYIVRSSLSLTQAGKPTLWCHYACSESFHQGSWVDPHLYLGPKFYERGVNCSSLPDVGRKPPPHSKTCTRKLKNRQSRDTLILSTDKEILAEEGVELWESNRRRKVRRRYAFSPSPFLLAGLGPWRLPKAMAFSLQTKKNVSMVDLREGEEFRLALPKGRLVRSVSMETVEVPAIKEDKLTSRLPPRPLEFWTRFPEDLLEWRQGHYRSQQRHFKSIRHRLDPHLHIMKEKRKHSKKLRQAKQKKQNALTRERNANKALNKIQSDIQGGGDFCKNPQYSNTHYGQKSIGGDSTNFQSTPCYIYPEEQGEDGWLLPVTRFTSSCLSQQLTAIDKYLFSQITMLELGRTRADMCSWRAPLFRALVFFSHRVSCLVACHILLEHEIRKRAHVVVRCVGVAYKCHRLHNQVSAEAVLRGLQSPPVYRLHRTWAYVRKHHASKYRRFEDLSKRYYDCRQPLYQKTYDNLVRTPPFLPSVSLLVAVLLGKLEPPQVKCTRFTTACSRNCQKKHAPPAKAPSGTSESDKKFFLKKFLSALQLNSPSPSTQRLSTCQSDSHIHSLSRETLLENLDRFFTRVSEAPDRRLLQDVEYFLDCHQLAASRYRLPNHPRTRTFLLHSRHPDMRGLFVQSLGLE